MPNWFTQLIVLSNQLNSISKVESTLGNIDILINNAGVDSIGPVR